MTPNDIVRQAVIKHLAYLKKSNKLVPTKHLDELDKLQDSLD